MQRIFCYIVIALTCSLLINVIPVNGQNEQKQKEWAGNLRDGTPIDRGALDNKLMTIRNGLKQMEIREDVPT
jgi:hypothetical protein